MLTPESFSPSNRWKKAVVACCIAIALTFAFSFPSGWQRFPRSPKISSSSPFAQVGTVEMEWSDDMPFWVWVVLPRLFPEKLPGAGGYTSLGLTWEPGGELPMGFTKETGGIPRIVLSDPSSVSFDVQRYEQFLADCAQDPRFVPNFILPEISYNINLSLWDKLAYRVSAIPKVKKTLLAQSKKID